MAKATRASFTIDGKTYSMTGGVNTLTAMEDLFSTPDKPVTFQEVLALAEGNTALGRSPSMRHLRGMVWAMMKPFHPGLTLDHVGLLLDTDEHAIRGAIEEVVRSMTPDAADVAELGVQKTNPPTAPPTTRRRATTGARSTSKRDGSVSVGASSDN